MQIGHIAGKVKGQDLALAFFQQFVAAEKTGKDDTALGWLFPFDEQIGIGIDCHDLQRQRQECPQFVLGEFGMTREPAGERICFPRFNVFGDDALLPLKESEYAMKAQALAFKNADLGRRILVPDARWHRGPWG